MHPATFSSVSGLYPLDVSSRSSCDNQQGLQPLPNISWGHNRPRLRTTALGDAGYASWGYTFSKREASGLTNKKGFVGSQTPSGGVADREGSNQDRLYKVGLGLCLLHETTQDKLLGREGARPLISQTGKLRPGGKGFGTGQTAKLGYLTHINIHAFNMHKYIGDIFYVVDI